MDVSAIQGDKVLQYLLQFPVLTKFVAKDHQFANEMYPLLPKALPAVVALSICGRSSPLEPIIEDGLVAMIEGFQHHDLRSLTVEVNSTITDRSLLKAVECCPDLHTLELFNAVYQKKTVLDHHQVPEAELEENLGGQSRVKVDREETGGCQSFCSNHVHRMVVDIMVVVFCWHAVCLLLHSSLC